MGAWLGFVAPQGTPPAIIKKLHDEVNRALKDPEIAQRLEALGTQVVMSPSSAVFNDLIIKNYDTWGQLIKQAGLDPK
jgi:tripartite-type tricarboxylate transporter receptor subunit TctC